MTASRDPIPVYLDQGILSHLREGKRAQAELTELLSKLRERNAVFVYSMTHVDECRAASQPEQFVEVLEKWPIYLMEFQSASDQQSTLSAGRARELVMEAGDAIYHARRLMEDWLKIWHFASGWLGETEAQELKKQMAAETARNWEGMLCDVDWDVLEPELEDQAKSALSDARAEMIADLDSLPFEQIRNEWIRGMVSLKKRLPQNYAQLDEVPDKEAVSFVFSCLEERDMEAVRSQFPQGFWSRAEDRETGDLAGLACMLFMCGLVRDRRVRRGSLQRRLQHFRGQFRDGVHIENAARCSVFITCDEGAARLARSIYAYAGVETKVLHLKVKEGAGR